MATKSKAWPTEGESWPANQSNAARDRDDAAMSAARIAHMARRGLDIVAQGRDTRTEMLYILAQIQGHASDILRLMERNGAPTRPFNNGTAP